MDVGYVKEIDHSDTRIIRILTMDHVDFICAFFLTSTLIVAVFNGK